MMEQLKAFWKNILSYTKSTWNIDDYPLRYKKQTNTAKQYKFAEIKPWAVQIINWWTMTELGETKEEAYQNLKNRFKNFSENNKIPRPGKKVPIHFATTSDIDKLENLAVDFFEKILGIDYYGCFISDESNLSHFFKEETEMLQKINSTYKLELTDLGDGNILKILTIIKNASIKLP